jgi:plasmid rolling circle replication initiator protein Rep
VHLKATIPYLLLCHKKCSLKNAWDSELLHCPAENYTNSLITREVFIVRKETTSAV